MPLRGLLIRPRRQGELNRAQSDAQNQLASLIAFFSVLAGTRQK